VDVGGYIDTHPVECTNNMLLNHTVVSAAARSGAKKIVFASSACVYPTNLQSDKHFRLLLKESDANFDEPGKAFSNGEYGWAMLMGELQLQAFYKQFGRSPRRRPAARKIGGEYATSLAVTFRPQQRKKAAAVTVDEPG
jgi:nucleoside-diphosphate-sugar epimerase